MAIYVAEYLGQRTDGPSPIQPVTGKGHLCPFNGTFCKKIESQDRKAPICSLRRNQNLYIVCEERLISTRIDNLTAYQKDKIHDVAKLIFNPDILPDQVGIKSETRIRIPNSQYFSSADFIVVTNPSNITKPGPSGVIMEVQGGGETSNTGTMQKYVEDWERGLKQDLTTNLPKVGPIQTNAWRRLQEQLFVKGASANKSGYGFVICVGPIIYDVIAHKLKGVTDLSNGLWEVGIIAFVEDTSQAIADGPVPIKIDQSKSLFTSFNDITLAIANQGVHVPDIFQGSFKDLTGGVIFIS